MDNTAQANALTHSVAVENGNETHANFLGTLRTLTHAIGPIIAGLVPGAAPVIAGATAIEEIAAQIVPVIDNVKNAANGISPANPAVPIIDMSNAGDKPADIIATDPAALAAQSISNMPQSNDEMAMRLIKLEQDVAAVISDFKPLVDAFKNDWEKIKSMFKQFGL